LNTIAITTTTVDFQVTAGTAITGLDFTAISGTLTFLPGEMTKTITVPVMNDTLDENDETFGLTLSNVTNAVISGSNTTVITITDDDPPVTVSFSAANANVNEGETITITVRLNTPSGLTVTVPFSTIAGTATPGVDYSAVVGNLVFTPGTTTMAFTVSVNADSLLEEDETLTLLLSNITNGTLGTPSSMLLTIIDSLRANLPTVQFAAASFNQNEAGGQALILVTLSKPWTDTVTVAYASVFPPSIPPNGGEIGGATAGSDYTPVSGTLSFPPSTTQARFTVSITDDTLVEITETVTLTLSSPFSAVLGVPSTAILSIVDNDTQLSLQLVNDSPTTLGQPTILTATLTGNSNPFNFSWNFGDTLPLIVPRAQVEVINHTYPAVGVYTATVTATYASDLLTATTIVIVTEPLTEPIKSVDLQISKSASSNPVMVNQLLTYTIMITNISPETATGVILTDSLPANVTFVSVSSICTGNKVIRCSIGTLPAGKTVSRTIIVKPTATGILTNTAMVASLNPDQNLADNTTSVTTTVGDALAIILPNQSQTLVFTDNLHGVDKTISIQMPALALDEPIMLLYTKLPGVDTVPTDYQFADHAFKLEFYQAGQLLTNYQVNEPMSFTIEYDTSRNGANLVLMYWNNGQWVDATTTCGSPVKPVVDTVAGTFTVTVCQAPGQYALFEQKLWRGYLPVILSK
jgi:uncharacterized repeat protein (TIGR01451 family)